MRYARASKLAAEQYCMVFQLAYGLETVVLRVFTVYGPRQGFGEYGGVLSVVDKYYCYCQ